MLSLKSVVFSHQKLLKSVKKTAVSAFKAHITWFSFEGEFVYDYPTFLYGRSSQATIEAMMPSRILKVTGQQLEQFFHFSMALSTTGAMS